MNQPASFRSWGGLPQRGSQSVPSFADQLGDTLNDYRGCPVLAVGNGRSYGDVCLNADGHLVACHRLDRIIVFDRIRGLITTEPGISIARLLDVVMPAGFVLPVVPGTAAATIGGAIANDVHGKDSALHGSFGNCVTRIKLLRSDGSVHELTSGDPLFHATIGGLGLTGVVLSAELKLVPLTSTTVAVEYRRFATPNEMWKLWEMAPYRDGASVVWLDLVLWPGSGVMICGSPAPHSEPLRMSRTVNLPKLPFSVSRPAIMALNGIQHFSAHRGRRMASYHRFHFPLDSFNRWNRQFGVEGLRQYQCAVPSAAAPEAFARILEALAKSGLLCTLAVIKRLGAIKSSGLLSFPLDGYSLALDFANNGPALEKLFQGFDGIVVATEGRLYPAKDARMGAEIFQAGFPHWRDFAAQVDTNFSSDFWKRVMPRGA